MFFAVLFLDSSLLCFYFVVTSIANEDTFIVAVSGGLLFGTWDRVGGRFGLSVFVLSKEPESSRKIEGENEYKDI